LAEKLVDKIFTASPESFRLKSKKIVITGHGIDTEKFQNTKHKTQIKHKAQSTKQKILTAGRIAPVKNYEILIEAAEILKTRGFDFEVKIAGAPILEKDEIYFEKLKGIIKEKKLENIIIFVGSIPYRSIPEFYQEGDLFVNLSDTGSIDKAILEAMACGLLVLTSNEAFKNILAEKYFTTKNPEEIAEKIIILSRANPDSDLRDCVVKNHGLEALIKKIINLLT
jgi:glycosyltransferase involved in cell wall biosynthesis